MGSDEILNEVRHRPVNGFHPGQDHRLMMTCVLRTWGSLFPGSRFLLTTSLPSTPSVLLSLPSRSAPASAPPFASLEWGRSEEIHCTEGTRTA